MSDKVQLEYNGGTLLVSDVTLTVERELLPGDGAIIDLYIRMLNEKKIVGDIEVSFGEIKEKFEPTLFDDQT